MGATSLLFDTTWGDRSLSINVAKMTNRGKPRGLNAARKLVQARKDGRWADLHYKKRLLGTAYKSSPFGGSSHAKGIVLEKVGVEAKQPTLPSASVCVSSSSRTARRSP